MAAGAACLVSAFGARSAAVSFVGAGARAGAAAAALSSTTRMA
jgi:hypothetical protein